MADRAAPLDVDGPPTAPTTTTPDEPSSAAAGSARPVRPTVKVSGVPAPPVRRARPPAPGQIPLFPPLPALDIEVDWQGRPRLWGHAYHPMCSYLASFPAALAHAFVARYTRPGDVVLDPFCGRGTTPLEACAEGRVGVGNDLNPLAHVLTGAKVDPPTPRELDARLAGLRLDWSLEADVWLALTDAIAAGECPPVPSAGSSAHAKSRPVVRSSGTGVDPERLPPEVALAFHPRTLAQVLFVRSQLALANRTDRFLAAALLGILHGKRSGYLSEVMPNAFSMAPRYVGTFAARSGFRPAERDLFRLLDAKVVRLARDGRPRTAGIALLGDARDAGPRTRAALQARALPGRARLVLTSPPYLRVLKYGYYSWLRAWFLGFSAAGIDASLDAHRREPYVVFLREVLAGMRDALAGDAVVALVLGDVEFERGRAVRAGAPVGLADEAWEGAARPEGYLLAGVIRDEVPIERKVTRLWGAEAGRATKVDRILVLATTEAGRRRAADAARLPIDWGWPPRR